MRRSPVPAGTSVQDRDDAAALLAHPDALGDPLREHRPLEPVGASWPRRVGRDAAHHPGERRDAGLDVGSVGRLAWGVGDPGRVAHERASPWAPRRWRARRRHGRRRRAASGGSRRPGHRARTTRSGLRELGRRTASRRVQLSSTGSTPATAATGSTIRRIRRSSAPRTSSQSGRRAAMALTAPGRTSIAADGRERVLGDRGVDGRRGPRRPRGRPGRPDPPSASCRRGWPARDSSMRQRPCGQIPRATPSGARASMRPRWPGSLAAAGRCSTGRCPCSTCSSTNDGDRGDRDPGRGRARRGSRPAARIASSRRTPSRSTSARARSGSSAPVISREPRQAMPNRPPSSSTNATTETVDGGVSPASCSARIAANALATPSGPSRAPPSRHAVEVRAEHQAATRLLPLMRPEVAVAVHLGLEAERRRLGEEPAAHRRVRVRPGEAVVAALLVAADRRERLEQLADAAHDSRIGMRTSSRSATASASA